MAAERFVKSPVDREDSLAKTSLSNNVFLQGLGRSPGRTPRETSPCLKLNSSIYPPVALKASCYGCTQRKYAELLQSGKHSDVTFIITDEDGTCHKIPAHRLVLASQSEYFDRMLFGEMREAKPGAEIPLPDTPLEAFRLLLKYAYTGSIHVNVKSKLQLILDIVTLADRFGFTYLKDAGDLHLENIIVKSNVLLIFSHAELLCLECSKALCIKTIDSHAQSILSHSDLLSLSCRNLTSIISRDTFIVAEIKVFRAVQKWIGHNKKAKEDSADLLKAVRLCEIPPQELLGEVECSGLYSKDDIYGAIRVHQKPDWNSTLPRGRIDGGNLFQRDDTTWMASWEKDPHWLTGEEREYPLEDGSTRDVFTGDEYQKKPTSILVKFNDVYLVNEITLQLHNKASYTIHISKDNKQWNELVDHMKYRCQEMQRLLFPKQAFKYLQFSPATKFLNNCEVDFESCSFVENVQAFVFRKGGVLAPIEAIEPQMNQSTRSHGKTSAQLLEFNQPYSLSALRFTLTMNQLNDSVEYKKFDVSVQVTAANAGEQLYINRSFKEVASQPCTAFEDVEVKADFAERVVTHVLVELNPDGDVQQATKKRKVADGSVPSAQVKFSVTSLLCWAS